MQGVQRWQVHLRRENVVLWSSFAFLHTLHTLHTFYKIVLYVVDMICKVYIDMRRSSRGEALMAVPRRSAPVFGRYAGVQGVQSWHSCAGAPPDVGLGLIFHSFTGVLLECCWSVAGVCYAKLGKVCRVCRPGRRTCAVKPWFCGAFLRFCILCILCIPFIK